MEITGKSEAVLADSRQYDARTKAVSWAQITRRVILSERSESKGLGKKGRR
jgi:hypothetical protein